MKAIQIASYGKPSDVAKCVELADVSAPAANEVVIDVEASPVNQYDLLMISGGYGYRPELPLIAGTEGAGRVVAIGSAVKHLKEGDRTLVPFLHPAWAQRIKTDAPWLRALPPGDVNQFAMMGVNPPTAYLLLTDIVKLPRGSWIIQNGANSGVGRAVVAIAKSLGLKTVNIVRREEVIAEVKALGGDVVVLDGADLGKRVAAETGNAPIHLALDGIADASPMNMMGCLADAGTLVSYGGTSRKPMAVHTGQPDLQAAERPRLLALLLVQGRKAGADHHNVRSSRSAGRRRHHRDTCRCNLRSRQRRSSHRQGRRKRRQGAVHTEQLNEIAAARPQRNLLARGAAQFERRFAANRSRTHFGARGRIRRLGHTGCAQRARARDRLRQEHARIAVLAEVAIGKAHARDRAAEADIVSLVQVEAWLEGNAP